MDWSRRLFIQIETSGTLRWGSIAFSSSRALLSCARRFRTDWLRRTRDFSRFWFVATIRCLGSATRCATSSIAALSRLLDNLVNLLRFRGVPDRIWQQLQVQLNTLPVTLSVLQFDYERWFRHHRLSLAGFWLLGCLSRRGMCTLQIFPSNNLRHSLRRSFGRLDHNRSHGRR